MIDLDYVQERAAKARAAPNGFVILTLEDVEDMVAELRAAREVVEVLPALLDEITGDWAEVTRVRRALAAYDEVAAS